MVQYNQIDHVMYFLSVWFVAHIFTKDFEIYDRAIGDEAYTRRVTYTVLFASSSSLARLIKYSTQFSSLSKRAYSNQVRALKY